MRRNRIGIQFNGFQELAERIDELAGLDGLKRAVEAGLKSSKEYVNGEISAALQKSKLPAQGKYSEGNTLNSLNKDFNVKWDGLQASVDVGLDFDKSGMTSIFLMYGTPRMKPDQDLYDAIYGNKTKNKIKRLQESAMNEVLSRVMGG